MLDTDSIRGHLKKFSTESHKIFGLDLKGKNESHIKKILISQFDLSFFPLALFLGLDTNVNANSSFYPVLWKLFLCIMPHSADASAASRVV